MTPSLRRSSLIALLLCVGLSSACEGSLSPITGDDAGDPNAPGQPNTPRPNTPTSEAFEPAPAVLPRLTNAQYASALRTLLGVELPGSARLEQDTNPYLFYSIGATTTELSGYGVEQLGEVALAVAASVFGEPALKAALLGDCSPVTADDMCAQRFIERQGRRLFRRALSADEVTRWLGVARDTAQPGDAASGLELVLAGMLQSPNFLYRVELGEPDPDAPGRLRYTSEEMAGRLAALLWNSVPDDVLLDAAARGDLVDDALLEQEIDRMLADPRARQATQDFFTQYLDLKRLDDVQRDPARYLGYTPALLDAMRTEVRLLVDDLVYRRDADIRTLFTTKTTFVNDELAALYGVEAPGASSYAFVPVTFDKTSPRAGLLTLGAFLTINAHPTETSPTLRGKYVRERLLCQTVPPPPDNVNLDLTAPSNGQPRTLRERLEEHRKNPACSGCHALVDPPGYLFEGYDSVGRWRDAVDGLPVDDSGELNGVAQEGATLVGQALDINGALTACMVKQLYRHANARLDAPGEQAALEALQAEFVREGHRFNALLRAMAMSEGFRSVAAPRGE